MKSVSTHPSVKKNATLKRKNVKEIIRQTCEMSSTTVSEREKETSENDCSFGCAGSKSVLFSQNCDRPKLLNQKKGKHLVLSCQIGQSVSCKAPRIDISPHRTSGKGNNG